MKSILQYFKPLPKEKTEDIALPAPHGPLSSKVPPGAIEAANERVSSKLQPPPSTKSSSDADSSRGNYIKVSDAQRFAIAKRAAQFGTTASMRYFASKYPDQFASLKEPTVRRWKNKYKADLANNKSVGTVNDDSEQEESRELCLKKTGRPLKLGEELDKQVREYVGVLRAKGLVINTAVVIASAEGILMHKDANLLQQIALTEGWAKYLLRRMGFVRRKATTKAKISVEDFEEIKRDYVLDMEVVVSMDEIPKELIINFDQTGIHYVPVSDWTMAEEGAKRVELVGKDDKRQLTAVFAGSMSGEFLPPQLVYQGKTTRCLPHYDFPSDWHITFSANHWSNEDTMKKYITYIILPYIHKKRKELKLASDYPALLTFDNFKAQCTHAILTLLDQNNINVVLVPANCTDRLQPLDLSVNKSVKSHLRNEFQTWYAKKVCTQLQGESKHEPVDLKLSTVKPLGAGWMKSCYDYIKSKPDIIINGFREAGILL